MTDEPRNLKELRKKRLIKIEKLRPEIIKADKIELAKDLNREINDTFDEIEALLRCRIEALIPIAERQEKKNVFLRNRNQNEDENWARERIAELEGLLGTKGGKKQRGIE